MKPELATVLQITSTCTDDTRAIGKAITLCLLPGAVVGLCGELGAGKTEFVKGAADALGLDPDQVTSPTFTLINEYPGTSLLYHFDLYRLNDPSQLDDIGAEEYFWGEGICLVEWADLFTQSLPSQSLYIKFQVLDEKTRQLEVLAPDSEKEVIECIEKELKNYKLSIIYK